MNNRICLVSAVISTALLVSPSLAFASFDQNLRLGDRGQAVISLQQFLFGLKLLTYDDMTGYFGKRTLSAVKELQSFTEIVPKSGFFGPLTRAKTDMLSPGVPPFSVLQFSNYVQFKANATDPSSYMVDFGDGTIGSMQLYCVPSMREDDGSGYRPPCYPYEIHAEHTYAKEGTYTAQLMHKRSVTAFVTVVVK